MRHLSLVTDMQPSITVTAAVAGFLQRDFTPTTQAMYERIFRRHVIPRLGDQPVANVSEEVIEQFRQEVAKTRSPITAKNCAKALSALFHWAVPEADSRKYELKKERESRWHNVTKKSLTLKNVLDEYLRVRKLRPSTERQYRQRIHRDLKDWLNRPIESITSDEIEARHRKMTERSPAGANYAMKILGALITFAGHKYELPPRTNPVKRLSAIRAWNKIPRRRCIVKNSDLPTWFDAVLCLENTTYRDFLLFLMLTGCRKSEAVFLRWECVDLVERSFVLLDTKNGDPHYLPICDYLYRVLLQRQEITGGGGYVFPGETKAGHMALDNNGAHLAVRQATGIIFTPHCLRRGYATTADDIGLPREVIKRLLNHRMHDVTSGYIVHSVERLRQPAEQIAKEILNRAAIVDTDATPAKPPERKPLSGPLETSILQYLLTVETGATVNDVWKAIGKVQTRYETVAVTLRRLCQRGYIKSLSGEYGGVHVYALAQR